MDKNIEEDHINVLRRKKLDSMTNEMLKSKPDLYYASTMEISHFLYEEIQRKHQHPDSIISSLSAHDIQMILSYPQYLSK